MARARAGRLPDLVDRPRKIKNMDKTRNPGREREKILEFFGRKHGRLVAGRYVEKNHSRGSEPR
jgi:hypothetical protein